MGAMGDVFLAVLVGFAFMLVSALLFKIRERWFLKLFLNFLLGVGMLFALSLTRLLPLPLNPLSGFLCGMLGVCGVAFVYLFTLL